MTPEGEEATGATRHECHGAGGAVVARGITPARKLITNNGQKRG